MNKLLTIAMTAIFVLSLQGPCRAQKEVAPPPVSPLLEGQRPLEHVETKEPTAPQKPEPKKAKAKSGKSSKTKKGATAKKPAGKKPQAVAKKKNQKAGQKASQKTSKKKRPAETRPQAGPDEG